MTLRPLGPSVTLTARASLAIPRRIASRASWSNAICFAAILPPIDDVWTVWILVRRRSRYSSFIDDGEHILLTHEEDFVVPAFAELVARPGGEQDVLAHLHLQGTAGPVLEHAAW